MLSTKTTQIGPAKFAEQPRRQQRDLIARLELAFVFELALLGPRGKKQRQHEDRDEKRRREPEDRAQAVGEADAGGEPDDHLAVAVPAHERQQHGDEHRDRNKNVEIKQGVEPQQREQPVRGDRAARGQRQEAQHEIGEQDSEQDEEQADGRHRHLSHQTAPEDHDAGRILTFWGRFANNAIYSALRTKKPNSWRLGTAMEFTIKSGSPEKQRSACVVVGVFDNRKLSLSAELIDRASNGYVSEIIRRGDMEGKLGATLLLHNVRGTLADRVLLLGLGKERDFRDKEFRSAIKSVVKLLNETGSYEAVVYITEEKVKRREVAWRIEHAVVVAMEAVYRFDQMKSEKSEVRRPLRKLTLSVPAALGSRRPARWPRRAASPSRTGWTWRATSATCPATSARRSISASARSRWARNSRTSRSRVLERKDIEALGMGSFLSVTNGSDEPPRFIVFEYRGSPKKQKPVVLVGKGITFDTGGISIKPARRHGPDEIRHVRRRQRFRRAPRDRRVEGEGQRDRPRGRLREHAVRPRDEARRRRDEHVRTDDRDPQYRRRGPADPVRCADLRGALRARSRRRHRDA